MHDVCHGLDRGKPRAVLERYFTADAAQKKPPEPNIGADNGANTDPFR